MNIEKQLTIVITGATSGFGKAMAESLSKENAKLILVGRREDRLKKLHEEIKCSAYILPLDVSDREAVNNAFKNLPTDFSDIDVLVNNAGLSLGFGPAYENQIDDWEVMINTNIKGLLYCTQSVLPSMVYKNQGHIINIGSIAAVYPYHGGNVYAGSKAFVYHFSLNLRADLQGTRVKVSCINPGMAKTEFAEVRYKGDKEKSEFLYYNRKPLEANDIAEAVIWCIKKPQHVNINSIELVSLDQPFSLGFNAPVLKN